MECNVCKKIFGTKNTLEHHKKTAKYCLELQGKKDTNYECSYCKKYLSTNERLTTHIISCKERKRLENKENEQKIQKNLDDQKKYYQDKLEEKDKQTKEKLEEKDKQILELKSKLEKFENAVIAAASEPKTKTTTNVVVNNNTLNLSQEHVTKVLDEHFTKEVAAGGQKGLAKMVHEKMLTGPDGKPTYVCVDSSRHTFEFTNNDGDVERDVKAKKLTKALINSKIQQKAAEVGNQIWTKADGHVDSTLYEYCSPKVMELACFEKDDSKFRSELSALTS
jgi:hypothetical protein